MEQKQEEMSQGEVRGLVRRLVGVSHGHSLVCVLVCTVAHALCVWHGFNGFLHYAFTMAMNPPKPPAPTPPRDAS